MEKLITVVTVVYNDVKNITRTVDSVLEQNKDLIEYIVVDGSSNDGTRELLMEYKKDIDILISEPDYGIYDAMNKGIKLASGKYIHFLNSGDYFNNKDVVNSIFADNRSVFKYDVIYGDTKVIFDNYTDIVKGMSPSKNNPMSFGHQSVFVKTDLMRNLLFDTRFKICADKNFFASIYYNQEVNYYYTDSIISDITAIGFSNKNRVNNLLEVKRIRKEYCMDMDFINLHIAKAYVITVLEETLGAKFINWLRYKVS